MPRRRPSFSLTLAAALTLGGGLAATLVLTASVGRLEFDNKALAFEQATGMRVAALRRGMDDAVEVLNVTNQLFATVQPVTRAQFHDFTAPLLHRHPYIRAFNFHRYVAAAGRAAIEAELQHVRPGTVLHEMRGETAVPVPERSSYKVVDYLEPMAGNEPALGLDVARNLEVARALERALASGRAAATGLLRLAQDSAGKASFEVVMPVYGAGGAVGDTAAVIDLQTLARTALSSAALIEDRGILLRVYLGGEARPASLVYANFDGAPVGQPA